MTISTTERKARHTGNGGTTQFFYSFRCDDESWMVPLIDDVEQTTGFTVDLDVDLVGGSVTFAEAPADGTTVTLVRVVPQTQQIDYISNDPFPEDTHELGIDKLTMMIQELQEQTSRSVKQSPSSDGSTDLTLPPYSAGDVLQWDETTDRLINADIMDCPEQYVDPYRELYGSIAANGTILKGSGGYSVVPSGGSYAVTFTSAIPEVYAVVVSQAEDHAGRTLNTVEESEITTGFTVEGRNAGGDGELQPTAWSFHLVYEVA